MTSLTKGANLVIPPEAHAGLRVNVGWTAQPGLDLDVAAIAVDATGRTPGADHVLTHDRPQVAGGALRLENDGLGTSGSDSESLTVDLTALPAGVVKVLLVLSIHDAAARGQSFASLGSAKVEVTSAAGALVAGFDVTERGPEAAMILGELYRHQDSWKFRAVGQGHAEGLGPIAEQVGVDPGLLVSHKLVAPPPAPAAPPAASATAAPAAPPTVPPPAAPAPAAPASSGPVILTKSQPTISLVKQDVRGGQLRVNLNWTSRPAGASTGGFLRRATSSAIDLDLGCLFEFADGTKGVVQALGNSFFAAPHGDSRPLIALDGDDRSGSAAGGENLSIDLDRASMIRRILLFAYIYEGTPNWAEANAVVTWYPVGAPPVVVNLDEHDPRSRFCAIAMLDNSAGQLDLRREVRYIQGSQSALDQAYGWGLSWRAGRK